MTPGSGKYWEPPSGLSLNREYWEDPLPDFHGMLSSDLIEFYNQTIGTPGMIDPFDRVNLKAASYELTLGPNCLVDGEERTLTDADPWLELPQNSIVFVSMQERLCIPHYIAARFDLAIEFIYKGILLGTGPQVDPGFQGVLGTPLHNISSEPVHIQLGYPFAKIDFAKTSGLMEAAKAGGLKSITQEDDLYDAVRQLPGYQGRSVKLFKKTNRWREPIFDRAYAGQRRVRSSLSDLEGTLDKFGEEISRFESELGSLRRFGLAGALGVLVAFVALLIALAQLDRGYTDAKITNVRTTDPELARRVERLDRESSAQRVRITQLERALRARGATP
jgi:deoxycytidine triphosphate deaminase